MGNLDKFWKGVFFGAIAGGALSLLDKETRSAAAEGVRRAAHNVSYLVKHPTDFVDQIKETSYKVRRTIEDVSEDVSYIAQKVEELRTVPPQVAEIMKETKEAFVNLGESEETDSHFTSAGRNGLTGQGQDPGVQLDPEIR